MFVLNRPARMIGAGIGFAKEYNADRKAQKAANERHEHDETYEADEDEEDDDHEWAQAIDQVQAGSNPHAAATPEDAAEEYAIADFVRRHPPPPYLQQQPVGRLPLPVILPQRRPESRTRGWVRGYAPILADADVDQTAWFEFLDGFEKSINKNNIFWAANLAVWITDKAYIASTGNIWVEPIVIAIHLSIEAGRRGYIHNQHNKLLDEMNDQYFKPRGLFALIVKYKPGDLNELGGWVDVQQNVTESVTKRDDPNRPGWKNVLQSSAETVKGDGEMPEFAPLIFPFFDNEDERQKRSAFEHFNAFRQEYQDRGASAQFQAKNPDSRLAGVAPQKEYASRFSNPNHPSRQGLVGLVTGGKVNRSRGIIRGRHGRNDASAAAAEELNARQTMAQTGPAGTAHSTNIASDGVDRNQVAWQAVKGRRRGMMRRLLRQDVLYLMVVNMPSEQEMASVRKRLGIATGS